jgi:hypothetical protein
MLRTFDLEIKLHTAFKTTSLNGLAPQINQTKKNVISLCQSTHVRSANVQNKPPRTTPWVFLVMLIITARRSLLPNNPMRLGTVPLFSL